MSLIITITGPSCAGKSTMEKMLMEKGFENAISTTTRPMRDGETNGETYHFIDKSQFKRLVDQGAFVEHVTFNGNSYGITALEIERLFQLDKPVVAVVEPIGMRQIREFGESKGWHVFSVFVDNPVEVIAERFLRRAFQDMDSVSKLESYGKRYDAFNRKVNAYSSRMAEMMTTEEGWRRDAAVTKSYDLRIKSFDQNNDKTIVEFVAEMAKAHALPGTRKEVA